MSRLECTPPVIISCLAGQTTARAPPCLKRPNCRPPRVFARQTPSAHLRLRTPFPVLLLAAFPRPGRVGILVGRPLHRTHRERERELTFRPGTAIIVVTRFFVCPRNSTSPPPLPIFFFLLPPCFRVARAVQIRLSRCDVPIRYPGEIVPRRWMRMSDGKKILSIDAATSWQFWNILIDWIISKFYSFFSRTNEFRFLEISSLPLVRVNISKRYIHLYSFRG